MKKLFIINFLLLSSLFSLAQEEEKVPFWERYWANQEKEDSTEITTWEHLNLETTRWEDVRHLFIPKNLTSDTLIVETKTLKQHKIEFKRVQKNYYASQNIDTLRSKFKTEMPDFVANQETEAKTVISNLNGKAKAINTTEISNYNIDTYPYVLKKVVKIVSLNPKTAHGEAYTEYYFYDRKEKKEYPHMSTDLTWLMEHIK